MASCGEDVLDDNVLVLVFSLSGLLIVVAGRNLESEIEPSGGSREDCGLFPNKNLLYLVLVSAENAQ